MLENVRKNLALWDSTYKWTDNGDEWRFQAEQSGIPYADWKASLVTHLITPFAADAEVIEIAPGHGRWTEFILPIARYATLVDISPNCLEFCRRRFAEATNVDYFLTGGTQLPRYANGAIDFVFSYDSFVHMSAKVIAAYLLEFSRVLRSDGVAIIHHADVPNVASYKQTHAGQRTAVNRAIVRDAAEQACLTVGRQFNHWDEARKIGCATDAITVLHKDK